MADATILWQFFVVLVPVNPFFRSVKQSCQCRNLYFRIFRASIIGVGLVNAAGERQRPRSEVPTSGRRILADVLRKAAKKYTEGKPYVLCTLKTLKTDRPNWLFPSLPAYARPFACLCARFCCPL